MTIIPTIEDLFNGVIASMNATFGITIPLVGKNFLRNIAGTWAGKMKLLYLFLGNIQKNVWFDTADPVSLGGTLERFGLIYLQRLPYAATQGQYTVKVAGSAGAVIPANTTYTSDLDSLNPGYLYILDTTYVLTGTDDSITLRATTAGSVANLAVGNTLTCTKPIVNVVQSGNHVTAITVSAIDAETTEEYRAAIASQVLLAPQGGAAADYIVWGRPVTGVAGIYPYTASGAAYEVDVYVEAILSDSGGSAPDYGYGVPTETILADVTAALLNDPITGAGRKPLGVILGPVTGIATASIHLGGGGAGYAVNDEGTVDGGTVLATYKVLTVSGGGVVTSFSITFAGQGYAVAAGVTTTATTGGGASLAIDILTLTAAGAIPVSVKQVAITFTGSTGMSVAQQTAIITALQQAVSDIRPFIAGADSLANQNDTISVNLPALGGREAPPEKYVIVVIAMAAAPGAVFTGCTMTIDGTPEDTFTFDQGNIPYLQTANVIFS